MNSQCYKLVIQFDGQNYGGWQIQKHDTAIQQVVQDVLNRLYCTTGLHVNGSGRTDAGVHAFGLTASFVAPPSNRFNPSTLRKGLNALLPEDIKVRTVEPMPDGFHGRYSCVGKTYLYFIDNSASSSPILRNYSWHTRLNLNYEAMQCAAGHIEGKQDFSAFTVSRSTLKGDAVRTIYRCGLFRMGNMIVLHVTGDGFLYKMVRSIAGYLVECGLGKHDARETPKLLQQQSRALTGVTAPAKGLFLGQNYYDREEVNQFLESEPQQFAINCLFDFCPG